MSCGRSRGWLYAGPWFGPRDDLEKRLCPWCIADGSAARAFDASFVDVQDLVGLPRTRRDELAHRTPSYTGWQQAEWKTHCDDAMVFVAYADEAVLREHPESLVSLRAEFTAWDDAQFAQLLTLLTIERSPTAYLFRCLHCGLHAAGADFD
jgi:hypothetical protein